VSLAMDPTREQRASRLSALGGSYPWVPDLVIVAVLFALAAATDHRLDNGSLAFSAVLLAPLLWRRRHPRAVFATLVGIALLQWVLDVRAFGDVALLFALYSVAVEASARTTLVAAAALEIGVVLATVRWAGERPLNAWIGLSGLATAAGVLGMTVRSRRALVTSLHERAARLEYERDQQGRLSAAGERARIAREMHDIVAHHLSVMIALADGASYQLKEAPERADAAMITASRTGRQALTEMRRLLGVLRDEEQPSLTPPPGIAQVDTLVDRVRAAGMSVRYELSGSPDQIEPGLQLTVHRIVQEALTNTLKHAGDGAEVSVTLSCAPDSVWLEVRNSGSVVAEPTAGEGGGLRGMRERAAVYDGVVEAGPQPGGGWAVRTRLALGQPETVPTT
jgi:signal transduction histidine kinase